MKNIHAPNKTSPNLLKTVLIASAISLSCLAVKAQEPPPGTPPPPPPSPAEVFNKINPFKKNSKDAKKPADKPAKKDTAKAGGPTPPPPPPNPLDLFKKKKPAATTNTSTR